MKVHKFNVITTFLFYLVGAMWLECFCAGKEDGLQFQLEELPPLLEILQLQSNEPMTPIAVEDVQHYPHHSVLHIVSIFPSGVAYCGSGFISGSNSALTAAHVVYKDKDVEERAAEIYCYISRWDNEPRKLIRPKRVVYPPEYINMKKEERRTVRAVKWDFALLYFEENLLQSKYLHPIMPIALPAQDAINPLPDQVFFCGYPGEEHRPNENPFLYRPYETEAAWYENHPSEPALLRFATQAYEGMSGSPIRIKHQGVWSAIGILSARRVITQENQEICSYGYRFKENGGVRLDRISDWLGFIDSPFPIVHFRARLNNAIISIVNN